MEHRTYTKKFNIERAKNAARDYTNATGMDCMALPVNQESHAAADDLCYHYIQDITSICVKSPGITRKAVAKVPLPSAIYCPVGLLHWASPVIIDNKVAAIFIASHTFLKQAEAEMLKIEGGDLYDDKNSDLRLKNILLSSPIINRERLQALKNMLDVIALSFSDQEIPREMYREIRASLCKGYECESPFVHHLSWQDLLTAVDQGDGAMVKAAYDKVLTEVCAGDNARIVRIALAELILLIYNQSLKKEDSRFLTERCLNALNELERIYSLKETCLWAESSLRSILEAAVVSTDLKSNDMLAKALPYIEDHYQDKLSLQDIADYVHFSAPYFCRIFKKEIGVTFSKYLTNLRIEKSKQLLKSTDIPLSVIPSMVGFEEQSYFTRVFHLTTGISPGKYRSRNCV